MTQAMTMTMDPTDMMETQAVDAENRDAAWVDIETPLSAEALLDFCRDAERLLRINSLYEFLDWQDLGDGRYRMRVKNLANKCEWETALSVTPVADGVDITYEDGLKSATQVRVEAAAGGAKLRLTDDYSSVPEAEREARTDEVDISLVQWGHDLYRYLKLWRKWSGFRLWRWYMRRVWQPMKPSARRITYMLIGITALEFVVFLFVFVIFWFELHRMVL